MENPYLSQTKSWIHQFVIAHQLCPFAKSVWDKDHVRYCLFEGDHEEDLFKTLKAELILMEKTPSNVFDTTFLIHPFVLTDFYSYLDFIKKGEELIVKMDLEGVIQLASFHPDYQFAGTNPSDAENYTNRSPYPMLHLLREESVEKATMSFPNPEAIPERNIALMKEIGTHQLKKIINDIKK